MDRTPAWMGIYRFVVEGRPLDEILREIEGHRGYRPKASVTLLYNRVLPRLAPERYRNDPTAALLRRCAEGTIDPYYDELRGRARRANPIRGERLRRVSARASAGSSTELDTASMIARVPLDPPRSAPSRIGNPIMTPRITLSAASERTTSPAISTLDADGAGRTPA